MLSHHIISSYCNIFRAIMIVNTAFRQVIDESKGNCGICGDSIQKTIGHLELECGCVTHYACFVEYIKSKSSLEIGRYNGVLCPYFVTGECKYIGEYFFNTSYFHFLVEYYDENFTPEQSSNDAMSTRFTSDDCERICSWVNTDTSGADVNTGRQLNPYVEVTTKACPKCTTRISHFAGHGCHHVMVSANYRSHNKINLSSRAVLHVTSTGAISVAAPNRKTP